MSHDIRARPCMSGAKKSWEETARRMNDATLLQEIESFHGAFKAKANGAFNTWNWRTYKRVRIHEAQRRGILGS